MSTTTFIDIETIPDQREGALERHIEAAKANFKAPTGITKAQMGADLGLSEEKVKFTSAHDLKVKWQAEMGPQLFGEVGEQEWRRTALDGAEGQLFSVAWAGLEGEVSCLHMEPHEAEDEFLASVFYAMRMDERAPFLAGHNVIFDLSFLWRRAVVLGVKPPFKLPFAGRHNVDYWCNSQAWTGSYAKRISQDDLCAALDLPQKPEDIDGSKVWDFVDAGYYSRVVEYNKYDVETTRRVFNRINFLESK